MAAKEACKSGLLIGKTFIAGKGKGFFHRAVSRSSPRFSRTEGGIGVPPDGSTSPRVTRSQSKLKQKKSGGSPKSSPSEPPLPVRKSLRKKTANSKYETEDMIMMGGKGSAKKETPPKGGTKSVGKSTDKELGRSSSKSGELSDTMDDDDPKKQGKPYSLRDREEKAKGRSGSKGSGKDGVQKPGDQASSGLSQSLQPLLGGSSKPSESCLETPERKKGSDESFDEKGIGSCSRHTEHDGKSISSGVSTCSADVALDPEILSLPPKFRRSKGKTISTSQSASSIEDDRSAEGGVHKDIKVDLCRAFLDHDHSMQSGCAKSQCSTDSAARQSETPAESSGEELRLEAKSSKIVHLNTAESAEHEELGSLQEQKSSQKTTNVVDVDRKVEADKKLVTEKNLELEKKCEAEKAPEPKVDKPNRSTGGKKSLLYRMSLSAAFDESETTAASKTEATVVSPSVSHREAVSSSVERTPSTGKPEDEPTTEINKPSEGDKTCRSQGTLVTKENEKTEEKSKESKGANREDHGTKSDPVEAPQAKSISEFPGPRGSGHPTTVGGPVSHGPVSHADSAKSNNEKNSKAPPSVDDSETLIASKRQGTPVTRIGPELETTEVAHDLSHQDVPTSGVAAEVKPKPHVSQPVEVIASNTKDCVSDEGLARSEIVSSNPVQLSTVLPSFGQSSEDNSAKSNQSFGEVSVRKDEFRGGNQPREVTERRLTSEAQRASKKRSLEDTLSIVRNKKLKKGENQSLERAAKVVVDETHQQMPVQVYDAQDGPAKEQETGVGGVPAGGRSSINPLHFYSHRKSLLPPPPPPSSSSGLSQTASPVVTTSHSDAGHNETTPTGAKKSKAPPLDVSAPKQSSRSGGRAKPDVISSDLLSSALDSEPPVLEKTDFTYMEQFSDISDSDEGEHRGPPMLEATSDCGVAKAKPCAALALDKHILFAKIASSANEKGGTSSGSRPEERDAGGDVAKEIVPSCGSLVNLTSLIGNASHLPVLHPISSSSTSLPVSHSPAPSSGNRPLAPAATATASHSVPPSASPVVSVARSLSPGPLHQSTAPSSAGRPRKSATRKSKGASKVTKQQSSLDAAEEELAAPSPSPAEFSSNDLPICKEGHRYSNSTLSSGDLESCGIVAPLPVTIKETVTKKKTLLKNKDNSHLATSDVKKTSDLSSLLQHCKSFSVVVQKIDEKGRKRQRRNNPVLKPDANDEDPDLDVHAVKETANAKLKTSCVDRKEATPERVAGPVSASTNRIQAAGRSNKVVGEKTASRKQKPKARKEVHKVVAEAREKSTAKNEGRIEKDEGKVETKDESLKLSVYDFDKDSNDEVDFETPLSSSRKESSKKRRPLDEPTKPRRPIRLKLHVAEHSPVPASTARGRPLGGDEKPESKALKEVQPSTPHSEKSVDSNEKLAVGPTDASIGHVKCRLVKVGRHQWMSVGDSNPQESSSRGGASDARSTSSTHDGLDVDESLPEIKIPKVTRKASSKELPSKNDGVVTVKTGRGRPRTRNVEPKKKQGKRATRAKAATEDFSVSDNSIPSMSRAQQSSGALSPNSVMDQASRCSESESVAISTAGQSSNPSDYKIPDFLDLLFGDDLQGFVLDVSETKVLDADVITRCAIERANFSNIYDSELDDYRETLSPASTFFVPSEIETQLAKMTLSDHPYDFSGDATSTLLSPSRQLAAIVQPDVWDTAPPVSPAPRSLAQSDFTPQENKENHLEVDRLLTQTSTNTDDGEDCLKNQFGDELMEEFVSWMSPKWDDMSPHDLEDPLNSLNLFSPFIDSPKTRQKLYN